MRPDLANRAGTQPSVRQLLDQAKAVELRDANASRELAQRARVLAHSQHDRAGEAEAFYRLASLTYYSGHAEEAYAVAVDAHDLASRAGAAVVAAWSLNLMGIVHFESGNHSEALSCCLDALEQYRATDHGEDEGNMLNTIATIHQTLGDVDRAIVTYEEALAANRNLARPDLDAITLANMAQLHSERKEFFLAVSLGQQALELAREHSVEFIPDVLINLGGAYSGLDDAQRGHACLDEALRLLDERAAHGAPGSPNSMVAVRTARGQAALTDGDLTRAENDLTLALRLARESKNRKAEITVHGLLATLHRRLGDFARALEHQEARYELQQGMFDQGSDLRIKALLVAHDSQRDQAQLAEARRRNTELVSLLADRVRQLDEYELEASQRLAVLAESRDTNAGDHSMRVGELAYQIATAMGDSEEECADVRIAARLHDLGKMTAPDEVLFKTGPLSTAELTIMKWHTERWAQILAESSTARIRLGATVARHHHERWDGSGVPAGLRGTAIPRVARIVSVADIFDALTHDTRDQPAWSFGDAVDYIVKAGGTQFDPDVVDAFLFVVGPSPLVLS